MYQAQRDEVTHQRSHSLSVLGLPLPPATVLSGLHCRLATEPVDTTIVHSFWEAGVGVGGYGVEAASSLSDHSKVRNKEVWNILLTTGQTERNMDF